MPSEIRSRLGFTPIELLVASATMSLLAGLLVPAFSGDRDVAIRQAELGNLRTIITLAHTYASRDPSNILGPIHREANNFINEGYMDYGGGPGTMNFENWGESFDPQTRPFNQLLYGADGLNAETAPGDRSVFKPFQCLGQDLGWQALPGLGSDPRETESPYFKGNGTSFRMNNLKVSTGFFGGIYQRPAHRIPAPGLTLAFMEARAFETAFTNLAFGTLRGPQGNFIELTSYHKKLGFFHVAYVDGHADFVDFGFGTYFEHTQALLFRDFRGSWGRMDTLPDPGIPDNDVSRSQVTANGPFGIQLNQNP